MAIFAQHPPPTGAAAQRVGGAAAPRAASAFPSLGAAERVLWVAPWGRAGAGGTERDPFPTPQAARDAARGGLAHMAGDVLIVLRGGRYQLASTLTLGTADGGQHGWRVRYVAAPGETPILSGGVSVVGWRQESSVGGASWLYSAPLPALFAAQPQPAPREIYVDGVRARRVRAPWPSAGGTMTATSSGYSFSGGPNPIATWRNPQTIEMVARFAWMESRLGVAACSGDAIVMQDAAWSAARTMMSGAFPPGVPAFVEHAYELLSADAPGQFWVDSVAGRLYYVPRAGEDLAAAQVLAPALESLITLCSCADVSLEGLGFAEGTWLDVNVVGLAEWGGNYYFPSAAAAAANDPTFVPGSLRGEGTARLAVRGCTFARLGGAGLSLDAGCTSCTIAECTFSDLGAAGLVIDGGAHDLSGAQDFSWVPTTQMTVQRNTAHDCNLEYAGGNGLTLILGSGGWVSHNLVYNQPYIGIDVRGQGIVEDNEVHDTMQLLVDGGNIYSYGASRGLLVRRNYTHSLRSFDPGGSFYFDSYSTNKQLYNNIVAQIGTTNALHNNGPSGVLGMSYNFTDSVGTPPGGLTLLGMNRLTTTSAPAPAAVTAAAGPREEPARQCSAPRGLAVTGDDPAASSVSLAWSAPAAGTPAFYEVYSADLCVGTTTGLAFTFADLAPGVTYAFSVRAVDAGGGVSLPCAPLAFAAPAGTVARSTYGTGWE